MIKREYIAIGQPVFFIEKWSGSVTKAVVTQIHDDHAELKCVSVVDEDGNDITPSYGSCGQAFEELSATARTAYAAKQEEFTAQVAAYRGQIRSLADLLAFGLSHRIAPSEEYTDFAAREAYRQRGAELYKVLMGTSLVLPE